MFRMPGDNLRRRLWKIEKKLARRYSSRLHVLSHSVKKFVNKSPDAGATCKRLKKNYSLTLKRGGGERFGET